jgi:hypothetical protein
VEGSADRVGRAATGAVRLSWVEPVEVDKSLPPEDPTDFRNTTVRYITNQTSVIVRVVNQEKSTQDTRQRIMNPGRIARADWFLPWCGGPQGYGEVTTKALLFRAVPPAAPGSRGSRLFYVFQDYGTDTAMWLPPGVPDFGMRDPIELTPNSGNFLPASSVIDLDVLVNPLNGLIVPGATVVTP